MITIITKMIFVTSLMSMCWWRKHIMFLLLSMEIMLITLFMMISLSFSMANSYILLFLLVMMVSGSSLSLSLLVSMSRLHKSSNSSMIWSLTFDKNYYSPIPMFNPPY